jgi:hypothetical protein
MSNFSIDVSDRNFNKSVPIAITNKQLRLLRRRPKKGEENNPLMIFWKYVESQTGVKPDLSGGQRYMVTVPTYNMLQKQLSKWLLKEVPYLTKGDRAHKTAVSMHMLNYAPTDITHPKAKDNVVYYLDNLTGLLHE